jgi:hypothetical protein
MMKKQRTCYDFSLFAQSVIRASKQQPGLSAGSARTQVDF